MCMAHIMCRIRFYTLYFTYFIVLYFEFFWRIKIGYNDLSYKICEV
jgi:hypothetical protein